MRDQAKRRWLGLWPVGLALLCSCRGPEKPCAPVGDGTSSVVFGTDPGVTSVCPPPVPDSGPRSSAPAPVSSPTPVSLPAASGLSAADAGPKHPDALPSPQSSVSRSVAESSTTATVGSTAPPTSAPAPAGPARPPASNGGSSAAPPVLPPVPGGKSAAGQSILGPSSQPTEGAAPLVATAEPHPAAGAAQPAEETAIPVQSVSKGDAVTPAGGAFSHNRDYTCLTGELRYVHVRNVWNLRYVGSGQQDRYGGSVTLLDAGPMSEFHTGQTVKVEGRLVNPESHEPSPGFRVFTIQPVGARK